MNDGDSGKYKLIFSEPAKPIGPIPFGDAPSGFMQGSRYTTYEKLQRAKKVTDLLRRADRGSVSGSRAPYLAPMNGHGERFIRIGLATEFVAHLARGQLLHC